MVFGKCQVVFEKQTDPLPLLGAACISPCFLEKPCQRVAGVVVQLEIHSTYAAVAELQWAALTFGSCSLELSYVFLD